MSIERTPNGRYLARWRESTGRQRARRFDRKINAQNFLASVTVDTMRGSYIDPDAGRETVAAYVRRWAAGQPWRSSTRENREHIIDRQILPTFGAAQLRALRTSDVQSWVGRLSASGLRPGGIVGSGVLPGARPSDARRAA